MNSEIFKRGKPAYEAGLWLLEHYHEIKFFTISREAADFNMQLMKSEAAAYSIRDVIGFCESEQSCIRRGENIWNHLDSRYADGIVSAMNKALNQMGHDSIEEENGRKVLKEVYFSKDSFKLSVNSRIEKTGFSVHTFYSILYDAVAIYSRNLYCVMKRDRDVFINVCDEDSFIKEISKMQKVYTGHSLGGTFYKDTMKLLKNYNHLKYEGVQSRICESEARMADYLGGTKGKGSYYESALDRIDYANMPDDIKKWMYSSMAETTNAYLMFIDEAYRRMGWLGSKGKEYQEIINMSFLDPDKRAGSFRELVENSGMSQRVYYFRRQKAIEMMSKVLWGALGHRNCRSEYYEQ